MNPRTMSITTTMTMTPRTPTPALLFFLRNRECIILRSSLCMAYYNCLLRNSKCSFELRIHKYNDDWFGCPIARERGFTGNSTPLLLKKDEYNGQPVASCGQIHQARKRTEQPPEQGKETKTAIPPEFFTRLLTERRTGLPIWTLEIECGGWDLNPRTSKGRGLSFQLETKTWASRRWPGWATPAMCE